MNMKHNSTLATNVIMNNNISSQCFKTALLSLLFTILFIFLTSFNSLYGQLSGVTVTGITPPNILGNWSICDGVGGEFEIVTNAS